MLFPDSTCLQPAFSGIVNGNELFLNPGSGVIELPAGTGAALLIILGMGDATFEIFANDGVWDTLISVVGSK